jgi:hypothetical protein
MARTNGRGGRNNNPSGRNQYSDWGMMEMVRERPIAAAATAVGAAAAGLFLWSKRTQISDQLSSLSDQIGEWTSNMRSSDESDLGMSGASTGASRSGAGASASGNRRSSARSSDTSGSGKTQAEIAEEALTLKETGKATA